MRGALWKIRPGLGDNCATGVGFLTNRFDMVGEKRRWTSWLIVQESRKLFRRDALGFAKTRTNGTKPKRTSRSSCAYEKNRGLSSHPENGPRVALVLLSLRSSPCYKVGVTWHSKGNTQVQIFQIGMLPLALAASSIFRPPCSSLPSSLPFSPP